MAQGPLTKTVSSFGGILVLAAVLWLILNFLYAPACGRYSCSYEPGWLSQAQADSGSCPESIAGAASDANWAADRIASMGGERVTTGLFYDSDAMRHTYVSAKDADADKALKVGRDAGVLPGSGRPFVVDHVEMKVAAAMRDSSKKAGVLVINNPEGPCKRHEEGGIEPASCLAYMPKLLPAGATLTVWWPNPGGGAPHKQTFVGDQS